MNKFTGTVKLFNGNTQIQMLVYKFLYERHRVIEEWKSGFMWPNMFIQISPDIYDEPESIEVIGKEVRKKKADPEVQAKYIHPPYSIKKPIRYTGYK